MDHTSVTIYESPFNDYPFNLTDSRLEEGNVALLENARRRRKRRESCEETCFVFDASDGRYKRDNDSGCYDSGDNSNNFSGDNNNNFSGDNNHFDTLEHKRIALPKMYLFENSALNTTFVPRHLGTFNKYTGPRDEILAPKFYRDERLMIVRSNSRKENKSALVESKLFDEEDNLLLTDSNPCTTKRSRWASLRDRFVSGRREKSSAKNTTQQQEATTSVKSVVELKEIAMLHYECADLQMRDIFLKREKKASAVILLALSLDAEMPSEFFQAIEQSAQLKKLIGVVFRKSMSDQSVRLLLQLADC